MMTDGHGSISWSAFSVMSSWRWEVYGCASVIQPSSRRISARRSSLGVEGGSDMEGQNLTPTPALLYLDKGMIRARLSRLRLRTSLLCTHSCSKEQQAVRNTDRVWWSNSMYSAAVSVILILSYIEFELKLHLASPQPLRTCCLG